MGNREYERGRKCNSNSNTENSRACFIRKDDATIYKVIISVDQFKGVYYEGAAKTEPHDTSGSPLSSPIALTLIWLASTQSTATLPPFPGLVEKIHEDLAEVKSTLKSASEESPSLSSMANCRGTQANLKVLPTS
jgi:hypothetical protein